LLVFTKKRKITSIFKKKMFPVRLGL